LTIVPVSGLTAATGVAETAVSKVTIAETRSSVRHILEMETRLARVGYGYTVAANTDSVRTQPFTPGAANELST
jgi:hypothetical protein